MDLRILLITISSLLCFDSFSQKTNIEDLISQIASKEIDPSFRHYYVVEKSIKIDTSYFCKNSRVNNLLKKEVLKIDPNIPAEIFDKYIDTTIYWNEYDLKKAKYVSDRHPKFHKKVYTINKKINQLDSLIKNKKPQTLFIRKKWFWSKKRIWKEVKKVWKEDERINIEDKIFYSFSFPIFSTNGNYVKITIDKQQIWSGTGSTLIYKLKDNSWVKVFEYNETISKNSVSDINPERMYVTFEKYKPINK